MKRDDSDPQKHTTGQGYPEEKEPGMGIDAHDHAEDDVASDVDAPESTPGRDSDPSTATGNPRAAGG